jgi:hypothetical protein
MAREMRRTTEEGVWRCPACKKALIILTTRVDVDGATAAKVNVNNYLDARLICPVCGRLLSFGDPPLSREQIEVRAEGLPEVAPEQVPL